MTTDRKTIEVGTILKAGYDVPVLIKKENKGIHAKILKDRTCMVTNIAVFRKGEGAYTKGKSLKAFPQRSRVHRLPFQGFVEVIANEQIYLVIVESGASRGETLKGLYTYLYAYFDVIT